MRERCPEEQANVRLALAGQTANGIWIGAMR